MIAVLVGGHGAPGLHALMSAIRLFRERPDGVLILSVGEVDAQCYGGPEALRALKRRVGARCAVIEGWCRAQGLPARVYAGFGADAAEQLETLCLRAAADYPGVAFFASRAVLKKPGWVHSMLHGQVAMTLQRRLHAHGLALIVLPMLVSLEDPA
jgi:hypothetical protein